MNSFQNIGDYNIEPSSKKNTTVDFPTPSSYTNVMLEECLRALASVSNAVTQLQATVADLDSRIDQSQSASPTGGDVMGKRIRERVPVGVDEKGAVQYEWVVGNTKKEFYVKAAQLMVETGAVGTANSGSREKHLFSECAERYLALYASGGVEKTTYGCYRQQMNKHVLPALGTRFIEDVDWTDVQQLYNSKENLNRESRRKLRTVLNIVFDGAIKDKYIDRNPVALVKVTGKPSVQREILTVEQMSDIISNIGKIKYEKDRRYMALAVAHAMIPEEILGLQWPDINLDSMQISIQRAVVHPDRNQPIVKQPKEDARIRTIDIVPGMERYIAPSKPSEGFVFGGSQPLSFQAFRRMYERVGAQINLYGATTYNFRHTVLTDAYDATGDVKAVQAQAGHATPTMTMGRYVRGRSKTRQVANSIASTYRCDRFCDKSDASGTQQIQGFEGSQKRSSVTNSVTKRMDESNLGANLQDDTLENAV